MVEQLLLPIRLQEETTLDNFITGHNQQLIDILKKSVLNIEGKSFFLWGGTGVGKTHLLQACCHIALDHKIKAWYLSFKDKDVNPQMLADIGNLDVVCLDDIHMVSGEEKWEKVIFSLYNQLIDRNAFCIISSQLALKSLNLTLPDLESRFSWGYVYQLEPLNDADKLQVLQQKASFRGLLLNEDVGYFLLSRCSRDISYLLNILDRLDRASLLTQRKLTVPFVKSVLGI